MAGVALSALSCRLAGGVCGETAGGSGYDGVGSVPGLSGAA